jgi:anti-sigma-K factor RskA
MEQEMLHEQAAGYALDILDEDEREAFERHLETCAQCREEIASLRAAAGELGFGVPGADPPPELRARLLERARAERPNVVPLRRPARRAPAWPFAIAAAAAAAVAIGLGIWGANQSSSLSKERDALRSQQHALAILASPTAQHLTLRGSNGSLAVTPDGRAALALSLPRAPSGKTYEAWVVQGKSARPAGLFEGGDGTTAILLSRHVPTNSIVAVTVEKDGGVRAPTGRPILTGARTA